MATVLLALLAALLLAIAGYTQLRIPDFTAGAGRVAAARIALLFTGVAFGYVAALRFAGANAPPLVVFLAGFGLVHLPAALILFVKRRRGSGKS
jgi:hypothetical protein